MKRLWAAVAILVCILAATLANGWWVKELSADLTHRLEAAQTLTERGEWERAAGLTQQAFQEWERQSFLLHSLLRHGDTDQIYISFQSVQQYLKLEEMDQYAAANAQLIAQLGLLAEAEEPSLKNVF